MAITKPMNLYGVGMFCCSVTALPIFLSILFTGYFSLFFLALFSLFLVGIAAFSGIRFEKFGLILIISITAFQPLLSMPLSYYTDYATVRVLASLKELVACGFLFGLVMSSRFKLKWTIEDFAILFFAVTYTLYLAVGPAPTMVKIVSYRTGIIFGLYYFIGRFLTANNRIVAGSILKVAFFVVAFGFIERWLFTEQLWEFIGGINYMNAKFGEAFSLRLHNGLPNNWFLGTNTEEGFRLVRRTVGPMGEGTSFARFVATPALLLVFNGVYQLRTQKEIFSFRILTLIFISSLFYSLGKGGIAIFLIGIAILIIHRSNFFVSIVLIILGILSIPLIYKIFEGNIARHFLGLTNGLLAILQNPFGFGLGTSGQNAVLYTDVQLDVKVSESYVGGLAYQVGLPGLFSYFLLFVTLGISNLRRYVKLHRSNKKTYSLYLFSFCIIIGVFLSSFLADSSVSTTAIAVPMILIGKFTTYFIDDNS